MDAQATVSGEGTQAAITGECFCGHIKYGSEGPIIESNYCDCRGCQRANGTLRVPWVVVPLTSLKIVAGEPSRVRSDAYPEGTCDGYGGERAFCPECGTQLFWYGDGRDKVDICAGTLDDISLFQPKDN